MVELWLPYDRFCWIMVDFYIASSYLRTSILSVFYGWTLLFLSPPHSETLACNYENGKFIYYHGNYATTLTSCNTITIMAESNILGITIHTVCFSIFASYWAKTPMLPILALVTFKAIEMFIFSLVYHDFHPNMILILV